jgi:hypothetical protein
MRGEGRLLRIGEFLVGLACRRLPPKIRHERYREWAAELPVILHDPEIRFSCRRAVVMLGYVLGTIRGASTPPGRHRRRAVRRTVLLSMSVVTTSTIVGLNTWNAVQAPGDWTHYWWVCVMLLLTAARVWLYLRPLRQLVPAPRVG